MSNLISIDELRKEFNLQQSAEEWKAFASKQNELIESLQKKNLQLNARNHQLESLLMNKFQDNFIAKLTPEENICIQQIDVLEKMSSSRALTLEEVKRLDLLVKNLKLIRDEATIVINSSADNAKEAELVAIVRSESANSSDS